MIAAVLVCATCLGLLLGLVPGAALARMGPAQTTPTPLLPLLPLARGQLLVSLGNPPLWRPVAGTALTVTLLSGRPAPHVSHLSAYVGFQPTSQACPASPRGDRGSLLTIPDFYKPSDLIAPGSPFVPNGGAQPGDYAVSVPGVVVQGHGRIRACVWLARSARRRTTAIEQDIPLLNGLLAASVSDVPSAVPGSGDAYTLDALGVGLSFNYSLSSTECGVVSHTPATEVSAGALASATVSLLASPCGTDIGDFTLSAGGGTVGVLSYPATDARLTPPAVATLGGCELDPVAVTALAAALQYVASDGCTVGRLLVSPYVPGVPLGAVTEAQVNGGIAEVAPFGTAVDLVLNGRPIGS
jgi:hypothetical protein